MKIINRLTEYQKSVIQYMTTQGKSVDQIVNDDQLKRADNSKILKKTVVHWVERFKRAGNMEVKKRSGRPRMLNVNQEDRLVNFIKNNDKMPYSRVKAKTKFSGTPRSINNYALRNKLSK